MGENVLVALIVCQQEIKLIISPYCASHSWLELERRSLPLITAGEYVHYFVFYESLNHRSLQYPSQENPQTERVNLSPCEEKRAGGTSCMPPFNANKNNNKGAQCIVVNPGPCS